MQSLNSMSIAISTNSAVVPANVVWSDDFNDGNIDDWYRWGFNASSFEEAEANFTLADGSLRAQGLNSSYASHAYSITSGKATWEFDVDCVNNSNGHFYIAFMSGPPSGVVGDPSNEYGIMVVTGSVGVFESEFVLYRRAQGSLDLTYVLGRYHLETVTGWHHIAITRNALGMFKVYFNGTLRISGNDNTFSFNSAGYFAIYSTGGPALDNIYVDDEIILDPDGPPTLNLPDDQEILENETFFLDLEASDYSGISTWWVNDTEHFTIDSVGDITNATILTPGIYGIQVSVNDTLNNIKTVEFTLTVHEVTPIDNGSGLDLMTLILMAGGGVLVIIVIVVLVKSRK